MMRQHAVDEALHLLLFDACLLKHMLQRVGRDVDMSQQVHVLLRLACLVVFAQFAIVVEEDGKDAALDLDRIRQAGIKTFKHMEHLIGMRCQPSGESVVHARSGRPFVVLVVELAAPFGDDGLQLLIAAETEQILEASVPVRAFRGPRNQMVQGM